MLKCSLAGCRSPPPDPIQEPFPWHPMLLSLDSHGWGFVMTTALNRRTTVVFGATGPQPPLLQRNSSFAAKATREAFHRPSIPVHGPQCRPPQTLRIHSRTSQATSKKHLITSRRPSPHQLAAHADQDDRKTARGYAVMTGEPVRERKESLAISVLVKRKDGLSLRECNSKLLVKATDELGISVNDSPVDALLYLQDGALRWLTGRL